MLTKLSTFLQLTKKLPLVHRGKLIEKAVRKSGRSVTTVVKRAGWSRTTYYNHIANKDLPLEVIAQYGRALGIDFSIDIPQIREIQNFVHNPPISIDEAAIQINYWKDKYYEVLGKYNALIEKALNDK